MKPTHSTPEPIPLLLVDRETDTELAVTICPNGVGGFSIRAPGYGSNKMDDGHGEPIYIELYDGCLTVHLWPDINNPDPTSIDMEGAREFARA
jgi:hypothetical protein